MVSVENIVAVFKTRKNLVRIRYVKELYPDIVLPRVPWEQFKQSVAIRFIKQKKRILTP